MLRLGILGSGKGSNFTAILEAIDSGALAAEVAMVISDRENAGILETARSRNLPARFIDPGESRSRLSSEAEANVIASLKEAGAELIVLAGFMRLIRQPLIDAFPRRIINIHPSLLPKFRGLAAWQQALEAGETETGCTVHYVDSGMDTGEILAQRRVPVLENDTAETLHARIQEAEHHLLPSVIAEVFAR